MKSGQHRHDKENIEQQRKIGDDSRDPIVEDHKDRDQHHAVNRRCFSLLDRIASQRGADGAVLDNLNLGGQRTGSQHNRQILGLFLGTTAGYDPATIVEFNLNSWSRIDRFIEDDSHPLADMPGGDAFQRFDTLVGGRKVDDRLAHICEILAHRNKGILDQMAGHPRILAHQINCVELTPCRAVGFAGKKEFHIGRDELLGLGRTNHILEALKIARRDNEILTDRIEHRCKTAVGSFGC